MRAPDLTAAAARAAQPIDVSEDFEGASAGLLRSVDADIEPHFPYSFRSTGSLLGLARWSASTAIPEYTFSVDAEYRTPLPRRSALSVNVPIFEKVDETMTEPGAPVCVRAASALG